jgi:hypothetical protein
MKIGGETRAAILVLENGFWKINDNADLRQVLIKPFFN